MPKIMIVDDDRTTVRLLKTLLEMDGFEVMTSARGRDVLENAPEARPDIFMVDFHLSDMTGLELITELRKHEAFASTPIVVASGLDKEDEVLQAGANRFLGKPFDPGALTAVFRELLG